MPPLPVANDEMPDVSILIVNFNGLQFLEECFVSIENAFARYTHEVVVVDNGSSDGSQDFLKGRTDICYIESRDNLGFTGGNNLAAHAARGQVLLLLNNDTRIDGKLDSLIDQALEPNVGATGSRLSYGDGRIQFSVGLHHSPLRLVLSWLGLERQHWLPSLFRRLETTPSFYGQSHSSVDWVSGACLATRRAIWERLGGLDDAFFMYCEDVDYCFRVKDAGFRVAFVADTLVTHYEGAGRPWIGGAALTRTARSYYHFTRKHFGMPSANAVALALAIVFGLRAFAFSLVSFTSTNGRAAVWREKSKSYASTAMQLFSACFPSDTAGERQ
jgi:GT2 family glycosyltransferase